MVFRIFNNFKQNSNREEEMTKNKQTKLCFRDFAETDILGELWFNMH